MFSGKGGIRPSYQAMDSTAVELPSYYPRDEQKGGGGGGRKTKKDTQNRMGFTW